MAAEASRSDAAADHRRWGRLTSRWRWRRFGRLRRGRRARCGRHNGWPPNCARRAWRRRSCSSSRSKDSRLKRPDPGLEYRIAQFPAHALAHRLPKRSANPAAPVFPSNVPCRITHLLFSMRRPLSAGSRRSFLFVFRCLSRDLRSSHECPFHVCRQGRPAAFQPLMLPRWPSPSRSPSKPPAILNALCEASPRHRHGRGARARARTAQKQDRRIRSRAGRLQCLNRLGDEIRVGCMLG